MSKSSRVIMSPPDYFNIEYSINPWMNPANEVLPQKAQQEWQSLRDTYLRLGLTVEIIPPIKGLPDLVFTTDHGAWIGETFYLSNFRYRERQKEQAMTIPWYAAKKIKSQAVPSTCFLEGGDVIFHHDRIFLGYGFRTSESTGDYLHNTTRYPVASLELVDEAFYHLDTCFLPVSNELAFYYPPAFTSMGIKSLKSCFDILIPVSSHEAEGFACNSVIVGKNILCQPNPTFEQKLLDLGYTPLPHNVHEFNKSGGGIHCLSQIIS